MDFLYRPPLVPSLIDEAWFPRYDIDEEALLEAEEIDLRLSFKRIRKAKAVQVIGEKKTVGAEDGEDGEETEREASEGGTTGSDDELSHSDDSETDR
jgi:hypothetical protein